MPYSGYVLPLQERPWSEIDALELMEPQICGVADSYFDGLLPIPLSEHERALLVLSGLQYRPSDEIMRIMDLSEDDMKESFRRIFVKASDYANGLLTGVSDCEENGSIESPKMDFTENGSIESPKMDFS
ncbi:hypothetical protein Salat_1048300 [Sesamum alatum]|uniref:Uncharacterized protein n=1 Tax=Sesamum alatum TaxID=300844 RepID=A0AAE2CSF4_9LAMI|nr:hypothetical protein Salat_1048300 [Sesamum alatum]